MPFKPTSRYVSSIVAVIFGILAGNSFAVDEAKDLALSKALAKVNLFSELTGEEKDALKSAATLRHGSAGERIIEQNKTLDRMFIVMDGTIEIWINKKLIATYSGQALVGEMEFLEKLPADADVLLLTETDLIELNNAALAGLMEKQPRLGYILMREIARIESHRLRKSSGGNRAPAKQNRAPVDKE